MYYLKLSGFIPDDKQLEFEQTYRFASTQIPKACFGFNISKDVLDEGVYHFISYWNFLTQLQSFKKSAPFMMVIGAFRTLGELRENKSGEMTEVKI